MDTNAKSKVLMEVKGLSFAYGRQLVIKKASLSIEEGTITTILGANGCGKSTLFSLMTKLLEPGRGKILLRGKSIRQMTQREFARQVAIVRQYNTAAEDVTVRELVAFGRTPYRKPLRGKNDEDERLITWAMEVTDLLPYANREVARLSGGQRQRVWIAMALAQNTKLLFLDEPTTYLDIRYQLEVLKLIRRLNKEYGITIVMVLHDINQAIAFSDTIIGMSDGAVALQGPASEVITEEAIFQLYGVSLQVITVDGKKLVLTEEAKREEEVAND